jgi:hypothetical protein
VSRAVRPLFVALVLTAVVLAGSACRGRSSNPRQLPHEEEFTTKVAACLDATRLPPPWVLIESQGSLHASFAVRADDLGLRHRNIGETQQEAVLANVNTTRLGMSYPYLLAKPDRLREITQPGGPMRRVEQHGGVNQKSVRPYTMYTLDPPGVKAGDRQYIDFRHNRYCQVYGTDRSTALNPFLRCQVLVEDPGHVVSFEFSAEAEDQLPRVTEAVLNAAEAIAVRCPPGDEHAVN